MYNLKQSLFCVDTKRPPEGGLSLGRKRLKRRSSNLSLHINKWLGKSLVQSKRRMSCLPFFFVMLIILFGMGFSAVSSPQSHTVNPLLTIA
jgi:hypothetical protein